MVPLLFACIVYRKVKKIGLKRLQYQNYQVMISA